MIKTNQDINLFFKNLESTFDSAFGSSCQTSKKYFKIANKIICLSFIGTRFIPTLTSSLSHNEIEEGNDHDLEICIWDGQLIDSGSPLPRLDLESFSSRGLVSALSSSKFFTHYQAGSEAVSFLDLKKNKAYFCFSGKKDLPIFEHAAPFRAIFDAWLKENGSHLVHAACLSFEGKAAMIVGRGGMGKSTTATTSAFYGLDYLGDDYIALSKNETPRAFSLYNSSKILIHELVNLNIDSSKIESTPTISDNKKLIFLKNISSVKITSEAQLVSTIIPKVTDNKESKIYKIKAQSALFALAPSTIFQSATGSQVDLEFMTRILKRTRNYCLELSRDKESTARCIKSTLEKEDKL